MVRIAEFTNPRMAQALVDYLAAQGVKLNLKQEENRFILWLDDETHREKAEQELQRFIRDPNHVRYQAASWQHGNTSQLMHYPKAELWRNIRERAGPLTLSIMAICVALFIAIQILGPEPIMIWLAWPADQNQYLQLWRWVSHAFLHFSLLHILFNLMWWWYLGGAIEKRLGSGKLFTILLISALLSGCMQAKLSGIWFGGLSGVVYALMGYCWLRGERDPQSGLYLERGLIVFALLWLVAGYYGIFGMALANTAHLIGLLVGLAMAFVDSQAAVKR